MGMFSIKFQEEEVGSKNQLLDGMEANSTKCMSFKFHDHTFIGEFSTANLSFGCKGVMYLVDFP